MTTVKMSKKALNISLKKLNLLTGDIVFVTSDITFKDMHISERVWLLNSLMEYLGPEGTVIMSLSGENIDVRHLDKLKLSNDYNQVRDLMPGFSKESPDLYANDLLAKSLVLNKEVIISDSFAYPYIGVGKYAKLIINSQNKDFPNGNMSPLARLYELRAKVLLIESEVSSFLLNNYVFETSHKSSISINGGKVLEDEKEQWHKFLEKSVNKDKIKKIITSSGYKRLFNFDDLEDISLISCDVRSYVDYCRKFL